MYDLPFFSEEHRLFGQTVRAFVDREVTREHVRHLDEQRLFPHEVFRKVAAQGWFGLGLPEAYGGQPCDAVTLALVHEALARHSLDIAAGFGLCLWGGSKIAAHGTEAQKQEYLPRLARGEARFSVSLSEPGAGSDLAAVRTSARDAGDHYVLDGQKVWASAADVEGNTIVMLVRTEPGSERHRGLSLLLVDRATPGLEFRKMPTLSRRILGTYEIFLTEARVPKSRVLGAPGQGWPMLLEYLDTERLFAAAGYVGNARTVVEDAVAYARQRVQFGRPIGGFQAIQHKLVDMQLRVESARLLVYQAAWLLDRGRPARREASLAKLAASEALAAVAAEGMQVLGGYSQLPEFDMERYFRDSRQTTVSAGTNEIQRNILAREMGL
jgi:alkylation response protein AidB-like acyl-CoA dehydrogenase